MNSLRQTWMFALLSLSCLVSFNIHAKSLEQSVAVAFNTNPDLKEVYHRYKSSIEAYHIARSSWYPDINLQARMGVGKQDTPETRLGSQNERIKPVNIDLTLNQILFDGFFNTENANRADFEAQSELFQLRAAAENKALEVVTAYLNVLRDISLTKLSEKNHQTHQLIHQKIHDRMTNGLGSTSDLSQATGRLARAKANVLSAQNNLADSTAVYQRLVGEQPEELVLPVPDEVMLPASKALLLDKSMLNHPIVKSAIADIKAAEAQIATRESNYLPRLNLDVSKRMTQDKNNELIERDILRADLVGNYNVYRGGQDAAQIRQSHYQLAQANEIKESAERQVIEGASFSWNAFSFIKEQLTYLELHVEQSFLTREAYLEQFEFGRRTLLDLLDTENELFEARRNFVNAETAYIQAQYRLFNSTGELLTSLRIQADRYWTDTPETQIALTE
ncbi:TolC family outer membrane protein [Algibacillus agarilyticus]|uniref:TolC family outer membrane protein n=1 Tax=Algibacillus agarilyticus TaxID=2234133 RepID=UPI001300566F|nr:TolC family outer membrane protein [Algibacillus agarilyticus]